MLCDNCGQNEANIRYRQNINGIKKELNLCEECSKVLGITDMDFSMPIDFSSFLGEFLGDNNTDFLPEIINKNELKCNKCGMTYDEFSRIGKFGCENCYTEFSERIEPILKNLQGSNKHVGRNARKSKLNEIKINTTEEKLDKLTELKNNLDKAIKEERYEDAAKLRDEINNYKKERG